MYDWRRMSPAEREAVLAERKRAHLPWHRPPHEDLGQGAYHLSAACYEHTPVIGTTPERMAACEAELLDTLHQHASAVYAWCVLPNHYHALVETAAILRVLATMGEFHGRTSFRWNAEDQSRGRQVWHGCAERAMRSERHLWATLNYVHHNPVHHGYCERWDQWPFSSAKGYLDAVGREEAERVWRAYPVLDYGKGWDDPGL